MKIKHYIVTYNNDKVLADCLNSLTATFEKYSENEYEVYIINNHTHFFMDDKFQKRITVLNNVLRPDFSTGHLSRNWNQAIINGFQNLVNPDCDIVITSQNDCIFQPNFLDNLIELHKKYSFVQFGAGDHFVSYTSDSIKKVGLWDERFCNIGYQEADYFLRQLLYNPESSTINDEHHRRIHNSENNTITERYLNGYHRREKSHLDSMKYHHVSQKIFKNKWNINPEKWDTTEISKLKPGIHSYIYYPYFEKDIITLGEQNYLI